jgi:hypothetical protein
MRSITRTLVLAAAALAALAGCATSYGPQRLKPGATVAEVSAALGAPTGRYPAAGGERIEYARGPFGRHTYMLDFDAQGRMTRWEQVLTENKFNAIALGESRDAVLYAIGHPSEQRWLPRQRQVLWSYRFEGPFCQWFQVGIDESGKVADTGYGPDPICEDRQSAS